MSYKKLDLSFMNTSDVDLLEEVKKDQQNIESLAREMDKHTHAQKHRKIPTIVKLRNIEEEKRNLVKKQDKFLKKLTKIRTEYDTLKGNMKIVFDILFTHKEKDGSLVFEIGALQDISNLSLDKVKSSLQSLERREFIATLESKKGVNGFRRVKVLKRNNTAKS